MNSVGLIIDIVLVPENSLIGIDMNFDKQGTFSGESPSVNDLNAFFLKLNVCDIDGCMKVNDKVKRPHAHKTRMIKQVLFPL